MLVGGIGSLAATFVFLSHTTDSHTSASTVTLILCVQTTFGAMVFAPWMAGFTETVEDRNPALMATGLAVSGGVLRVVIGVTIFLFPFVVPAVTPLVDYGPQVQQYSSEYASQIATADAIQPATLRSLQQNPGDFTAVAAALDQIEVSQHITAPAALSRLESLGAAAGKLTYLAKHSPAVVSALKKDPLQWQHWFLVTAAGQLVFLPLVFVMVGPWTPAGGRRRDREQERQLQASVDAMT
jgi:hypothetical protein